MYIMYTYVLCIFVCIYSVYIICERKTSFCTASRTLRRLRIDLSVFPLKTVIFFSTVLHILKFSPEILDLNRRQNLIQCNVFLTFMYNKPHVTGMYIFSIGNFFRNMYYKYSNFISISLVKNTFFFFF